MVQIVSFHESASKRYSGYLTSCFSLLLITSVVVLRHITNRDICNFPPRFPVAANRSRRTNIETRRVSSDSRATRRLNRTNEFLLCRKNCTVSSCCERRSSVIVAANSDDG